MKILIGGADFILASLADQFVEVGAIVIVVETKNPSEGALYDLQKNSASGSRR